MSYKLLLIGALFFMLGSGEWNPSGIREVKAQGCYEAWSRCTGWSSGATGILWRSCANRCRTCAGRQTGSCKTGNFGCGSRQQCVCSGKNVPRSGNLFDRVTCRVGL